MKAILIIVYLYAGDVVVLSGGQFDSMKACEMEMMRKPKDNLLAMWSQKQLGLACVEVSGAKVKI